MSKGGGATGLEIVPRKGHVLFKFYIDTNSKNMTPISVLDVADFTKALTDIEQNENVEQPESAPVNGAGSEQRENADTQPSYSQVDIDYLNSIINGFNFAAADLDELENKLEAISERLTPETEDLFEQAAEAFAQYAISLEV